MINFNNTYSKLPERFFKRNKPAHFPDPKLLAFNTELAAELEIAGPVPGIENRAEENVYADDDLAHVFSGQKILPGSEPLSQAYAGYQFGQPVAQLGDGRAHYLGETNGFEVQLKGSGRTAFSRGGDGRSSLGPVIREYLVSEAMAALGVPTTRALAAVRTGEEVVRQFGPEPGGVFTRVAPTHVRVGTFQYFAFKNDLEAIEILLKYVVEHFYPELQNLPVADQCIGVLQALTCRQAELIAHWKSLGFIHGVMNTDNFSVVGITIDYGPCAFMDQFSYDKVFSSIDHSRRYSYANQTAIAKWNLFRLADCFVPLVDDDEAQSVQLLTAALEEKLEMFEKAEHKAMTAKLGLPPGTEQTELVYLFLAYCENEQLDFTLAFRNLPELYCNQTDFFPQTTELSAFTEKWKAHKPDVEKLHAVNPLIIPRNHQVERVIQSCYQGNDEAFLQMLEAGKKPFEKNEAFADFAMPPKGNEIVRHTYCGT
ncbi:MAG: protein adenylyltransferase SelO family protein [Candidatus Electrothrix sp. Rat3]|nr:protein adenylyltransferase SelO family protein [Candidatus Electrothrix rattekaaiensis]